VIAVPAVLGAVVVASLITYWAGRTGPAATAAQAGQVGEGAVTGTRRPSRRSHDILAVAAVAAHRGWPGATVHGRRHGRRPPLASWAFMAAVAVGFAVAALPWVVARVGGEIFAAL
jgi:hypothetical protein